MHISNFQQQDPLGEFGETCLSANRRRSRSAPLFLSLLVKAADKRSAI